MSCRDYWFRFFVRFSIKSAVNFDRSVCLSVQKHKKGEGKVKVVATVESHKERGRTEDPSPQALISWRLGSNWMATVSNRMLTKALSSRHFPYGNGTV